MTGILPLEPANITLYPVPNDGRFTVSITSPSKETFNIQAFNIFSVMITQINGIEVKGTIEKEIDLRPVAEGIYTIVIWNSNARIVKKILVNK